MDIFVFREMGVPIATVWEEVMFFEEWVDCFISEGKLFIFCYENLRSE